MQSITAVQVPCMAAKANASESKAATLTDLVKMQAATVADVTFQAVTAVFVAKHGKNDKLPGAFLSSLHAAVTASSYQNGVRQTLKAGGACCGRAQLVRAKP